MYSETQVLRERRGRKKLTVFPTGVPALCTPPHTDTSPLATGTPVVVSDSYMWVVNQGQALH